MATAIRQHEALRLLEGDSIILGVARDVTRVLSLHGFQGAVVGGIAVFLHGYRRTTSDVDVYLPENVEAISTELEKTGFLFDAKAKEFRKDGIPVHLVTVRQIARIAHEPVERDNVRVVDLRDLISIKLYSGTKYLSRAIDIADVIGLIRARGLTSRFASQLPKEQRETFRGLVRAIASDDACS